MDTQREVLVAAFQRLEAGIGTHGALEIALDAAHDIVLFAHAVQREVDDYLGSGGRLQYALDAGRNDFILYPVGGNVDDAGTAVTIGGFDHLGQVFAQCWLAATEGEPVGVPADGGKCFLVLFDGKIVVGPLPDIACFTARITAITYTDRQI